MYMEVLIAVGLIIGYLSGFLKSLLPLVGTLLTLLILFMFEGNILEFSANIYSNYVGGIIENRVSVVTNEIHKTKDADVNLCIDTLIDKTPVKFKKGLSKYLDSHKNEIESHSSDSVDDFKVYLMSLIKAYTVKLIFKSINVLLYVVLSLIFMLLLLPLLTNVLSSIKLIGLLDKLIGTALGGVLGFLIGYIIKQLLK